MKTAEQIELVFGIAASLAYHTLCWKEIRVSSKISVLPSKTFTQTLNVEHFAQWAQGTTSRGSVSSSSRYLLCLL